MKSYKYILNGFQYLSVASLSVMEGDSTTHLNVNYIYNASEFRFTTLLACPKIEHFDVGITNVVFE